MIGGESSTWTYVLSGVPQESVLGTLILVVYIDDHFKYLRSRDLIKAKLFAGYSKLLSVVRDEQDLDDLRRDIWFTCECSRVWQIKLIVE